MSNLIPKIGDNLIDNIIDQVAGLSSGGNPIKSWGNTPESTVGTLLTTSMTERINVSGEGWVICVMNPTASTYYGSLEIDGSYVFGNATQGKTFANRTMFTTVFKYSTSFRFLSSNQNMIVVYVEGNEFNKAIAKLWTGRLPTGGTHTTRQSVSGSGWIFGIDSGGISVSLDVDGNTLLNEVQIETGLPLLYRFESSFDFKTNATGNYGISYVLD